VGDVRCVPSRLVPRDSFIHSVGSPITVQYVLVMNSHWNVQPFKEFTAQHSYVSSFLGHAQSYTVFKLPKLLMFYSVGENQSSQMFVIWLFYRIQWLKVYKPDFFFVYFF
jgi:hypothetical protein